MTKLIQCPDTVRMLRQIGSPVQYTFMAYRSGDDRFGIALTRDRVTAVYPWLRRYGGSTHTYKHSYGIEAEAAMGFIVRDLLAVSALIDEHLPGGSIQLLMRNIFRVIAGLYGVSGKEKKVSHKGLVNRYRSCPRDIREAYRRPYGVKGDIAYALNQLKILTNVPLSASLNQLKIIAGVPLDVSPS